MHARAYCPFSLRRNSRRQCSPAARARVVRVWHVHTQCFGRGRASCPCIRRRTRASWAPSPISASTSASASMCRLRALAANSQVRAPSTASSSGHDGRGGCAAVRAMARATTASHKAWSAAAALGKWASASRLCAKGRERARPILRPSCRRSAPLHPMVQATPCSRESALCSAVRPIVSSA